MRLLLVLCITLISLTACREGSAETETIQKPYKATTVDECIEEKECVWYAFVKQLGLDDYSRWTVNGKSIQKWERPFTALVTSSGFVRSSDYFPMVKKNIFKSLEVYLPFSFRPGAAYTIFFAEDINETMLKIEKDITTLNPTSRRSKLKYNQYHDINEGCYSMLITEGKQVGFTRAVTVVDTKHLDAIYCTATHLYHVLGFWGYLKDQPFSFLSNTSNRLKLTKLDKFLVYLLYQPEFKSGQQLKEIEKTFNQIYENTKNNFKKIK